MATLIFHSPTRELPPVPQSMDPPVHAAELNHRNNYGPLSSPNPISLRIRARLSLARAREPVAAAAASSSSSEEPEPQRRRAPPPIGRPLGERERERSIESYWPPPPRPGCSLVSTSGCGRASPSSFFPPSPPPPLPLLKSFYPLPFPLLALLDPDWRCGRVSTVVVVVFFFFFTFFCRLGFDAESGCFYFWMGFFYLTRPNSWVDWMRFMEGNGILVGYSDGGFAGRLGFREPDRGRGGGELIRGGGGGGGGENMW